MTDIKFSYVKNSKGKYTFKLIQDGIIMFEKDYAPKLDQNQHILSSSLVEILNEDVQKELDKNPNFKWTAFEDAKRWMSLPSRIDAAIQRKNEHMAKTIA